MTCGRWRRTRSVPRAVVRCQSVVGLFFFHGLGTAVDYKQARQWLEKAAAQDQPNAITTLGSMYSEGKGVIPRWRRARELHQRAIELGSSESVEGMQNLTQSIQNVS